MYINNKQLTMSYHVRWISCYILQYPPPIGIDMKLLQDEPQRMMNGWGKGGMNKSENVMIDHPPSVVEQE